MRRGFTLIELMVVMAMIAVIAAAFVTSVAKARQRAFISRATAEVREMTNAILAYEQYAENRSLASVARGAWTDCSEGEMGMILGNKTGDNGERIPVLYNAHVRAGYLRDPWGKPYQFLIENTGALAGGGDDEAKGTSYSTAAALPNFFRITDAERR